MPKTEIVLFQLLIDGTLYGMMYGLAAIGLSLIFGTMKIVFVAQGTIMVFFAYLCYWLFNLAGLDPYVCLALLIPLSFGMGVGLYLGVFKESALQYDRIGSLLLAVGIMFFMENSMLVMWRPNLRSVVTKYAFHVLEVSGIKLTLVRAVSLLIGFLSIVAINFFLRKTITGIAVQAASEDMETTALMGIKPHKVNLTSFAVGISAAAVAGVNLAVTYSFDPMYGLDLSIKGLIALTLGGMETAYGAFFGGFFRPNRNSVRLFHWFRLGPRSVFWCLPSGVAHQSSRDFSGKREG